MYIVWKCLLSAGPKTLFLLRPIKIDTCPRRQTENLGKPPAKCRLPRFLAKACRQYVHPSSTFRFHVIHPPSLVGSRETSRRRKLFAACTRLFHRELSLSPSIAIHPYGGNKAPNKRFRADGPNVRTENPILACRAVRLVRVPSHRLLSTVLFRLRVLPSISLPTSSFYFLIRPSYFSSSSSFSSSVSLRMHLHIHRNWSLTTAKYYHIPIKITSSLLQILFRSPSFSAIFPFPFSMRYE